MELNMQLANVVSANEQQRLRSRAVFQNNVAYVQLAFFKIIIIICGQYRKCGEWECVLFLIIYNKNKHKGGSERRDSVVVSTE